MNSCPIRAIQSPAPPFPCSDGRELERRAPFVQGQIEEAGLQPPTIQPAMALQRLPPLPPLPLPPTTRPQRKVLPQLWSQPPAADESLRDVPGCGDAAALELEARFQQMAPSARPWIQPLAPARPEAQAHQLHQPRTEPRPERRRDRRHKTSAAEAPAPWLLPLRACLPPSCGASSAR